MWLLNSSPEQQFDLPAPTLTVDELLKEDGFVTSSDNEYFFSRLVLTEVQRYAVAEITAGKRKNPKWAAFR